jgi:phospholipase C
MNILEATRLWAAAAYSVIAVMATTPARAFDWNAPTETPIKHLIVIFDENNSFDHYFGTYPVAANPPGEPSFTAAADTPSVNGLNAALLNSNPNSVAPFRLDRSQAALDCDNSNAYAAEQLACDHGLADKFPENTSAVASAGSSNEAACPDPSAKEEGS